MEFTLVYRGSLKANGDPKHKQQIRRVMHAQLKELMKASHMKHAGPPDEILTCDYVDRGLCCVRNVGGFEFAGLVSEEMHLVAELSILLLRPEASGVIVTKGGDIDNRLKTLLDALRIPQTRDLPKSDSPQEGENPFYCLLEDDKLITRLDITSDRLLESQTEPTNVNLIIRVRMKPTQITCDNIRFLQ
jgi:hypothetical protein